MSMFIKGLGIACIVVCGFATVVGLFLLSIALAITPSVKQPNCIA
ncbi:MAG: hypothetical protein PHO48_04555 [Candidatus Gracilibacteria bacterium]|nr:hypothetical protein [Candidatus Gracilibacteria bacterium]MDD5179359.1 hypothetical protein [Candidatus Gracilibacteria bacterium]